MKMMRQDTLKIYEKKPRILKVENSLLKLEKDFKELKEREFKNREKTLK